jgi:hypothetical protein
MMALRDTSILNASSSVPAKNSFKILFFPNKRLVVRNLHFRSSTPLRSETEVGGGAKALAS